MSQTKTTPSKRGQKTPATKPPRSAHKAKKAEDVQSPQEKKKGAQDVIQAVSVVRTEEGWIPVVIWLSREQVMAAEKWKGSPDLSDIAVAKARQALFRMVLEQPKVKSW